MKRIPVMAATLCVGVSLFFASFTQSQETKPAAKAKAAEGKAAGSKAAEGKPVEAKAGDSKPAKSEPGKAAADEGKAKKVRLPNYVGKLNLTPEQRTKIETIQTSHAAEQDKLEKAMADLRAKQSDEILAVLTAEQRTKYTELSEAAKKKREARAKEAAKEDEEPDMPVAPAAK